MSITIHFIDPYSKQADSDLPNSLCGSFAYTDQLTQSSDLTDCQKCLELLPVDYGKSQLILTCEDQSTFDQIVKIVENTPDIKPDSYQSPYIYWSVKGDTVQAIINLQNQISAALNFDNYSFSVK